MSKRQSPMAAGPPKRFKDDGMGSTPPTAAQGVSGGAGGSTIGLGNGGGPGLNSGAGPSSGNTGNTGANSGGAGAAGIGGMDPDQLTDVLLSAGVDLQEESTNLSSTLPAEGMSGATPAPLITDVNDLFLDYANLSGAVRRGAHEQGVRIADGPNLELAGLLAAACEEWLAEIITGTALYSRHRRLSKNDNPSSVSKALRTIVQQDKDLEQRRQAEKLAMGIGGSGESRSKLTEETMHRAANDTAAMMTMGKKQYSWLSSGTGQAHATPPARTRGGDGQRFKEVKEDQAIVLRDLLNALENKQMGVKKVLAKGYSKVRD